MWFFWKPDIYFSQCCGSWDPLNLLKHKPYSNNVNIPLLKCKLTQGRLSLCMAFNIIFLTRASSSQSGRPPLGQAVNLPVRASMCSQGIHLLGIMFTSRASQPENATLSMLTTVLNYII